MSWINYSGYLNFFSQDMCGHVISPVLIRLCQYLSYVSVSCIVLSTEFKLSLSCFVNNLRVLSFEYREALRITTVYSGGPHLCHYQNQYISSLFFRCFYDTSVYSHRRHLPYISNTHQNTLTHLHRHSNMWQYAIHYFSRLHVLKANAAYTNQMNDRFFPV